MAQSFDSGGQAAGIRTDLSKALDCIDHELLFAKLNTCGFNNLTLRTKSKELKQIIY